MLAVVRARSRSSLAVLAAPRLLAAGAAAADEGSAQRLGLDTLDQMVAALVAAVEAPAASRIVEVPDIRATPVERERRQARNATFFVARLACSACLAFPHRDHTRINTPCAGRPVACAIAVA